VPSQALPDTSPSGNQQNGVNNFIIDNTPFDASSLDIGNSGNVPTNVTGLEHSSLLPQESDFFNHSSVGSMSDLESLFESSNGLIWNDLFDTTFDMAMPLIHDQLQDQPYGDPLSLLAHVANQPQNQTTSDQSLEYAWSSNQPYGKQSLDTMNLGFDVQPPPYAPKELDEAEVLRDAQFLLRHFREAIIPQFGPLPMNCRSPWESMNWSTAVQTHAELTWLQSSSVKHANQANLFAIIGCSAHMVARLPPTTTELDSVRGMQILEYASRRAKKHMQESLRLETSGEGKAKYKDQLMAIFSLIALAVSQVEALNMVD
jgi:arginine metabolism regulation protein II